jgi:hypothetical protein
MNMQNRIDDKRSVSLDDTAGEKLLQWSGGKFHPSETEAVLARHRLLDLDLFNDEALVDLLDHYPRNRLQAWTMGSDPLRREDWKPVETTGASGKELLAAVKSGRLWYNILRIDLFDRRYREIVDRLYTEMAADCPGFKPLSAVGTLLLSSPDALVYYHADGPPTALFHVRGRKRMWVYPAGDQRFVSQYFLEEIFGSAMDEEVPYSPEFDKHAAAFDLKPGDAIWWPQNAPHRIHNLGTFNVSLSTRYQTEASERRKLVYNANRFFRRKLGLQSLSVKEGGLIPSFKCFTYRVCRRAGLDRNPPGYVYKTTLRVDASAPLGFSVMSASRKTSFSL